MSGASACKSGWGLRRFASMLRQDGGTAAIEFALVAVPFIGLSFAIIETAAMMFTDTVVQGAVTTAARQIRTGQLQAGSGSTAAQQAAILQSFQQQVCTNLYAEVSCSGLFFDVRNFTSFGAISIPAPTFDTAGNVTNASFNTGASSATSGASSIISVRVIYVWNAITPGLSYILGSGAGQPITIIYTVILRNEPF